MRRLTKQVKRDFLLLMRGGLSALGALCDESEIGGHETWRLHTSCGWLLVYLWQMDHNTFTLHVHARFDELCGLTDLQWQQLNNTGVTPSDLGRSSKWNHYAGEGATPEQFAAYVLGRYAMMSVDRRKVTPLLAEFKHKPKKPVDVTSCSAWHAKQWKKPGADARATTSTGFDVSTLAGWIRDRIFMSADPVATEIEHRVSYGTTDHLLVKCLYYDDDIAIVKWPGGTYQSGGTKNYCSPWVRCYTRSEMGTDSQRCKGLNVWDNARDKDGPLTKKKLQGLIERLRKPKLAKRVLRTQTSH